MNDQLLGTVIAARFRIDERVAGGASSWVYRATDLSTGDLRAVKILTEPGNPELQSRFEAEMELLRRLRHPYIVQVHAVGVVDECPYMVMDFVDGGSVLALRNEDGPLLLDDGVVLAIQVLSALAEAHAGGVVHRDVKPGNVLVDEAGHARLCDFGIARYAANARARLTATGSSLGTLLYMAPEQRLDAHRADLTVDLYGVGSLLFRLLSDENPADLFTAEKSDARWGALPKPVRGVVGRATRAMPEERWQDARSMAEALLNLLPPDRRAAVLALPGGDPSTFRAPDPAVKPNAPPTEERTAVAAAPPPGVRPKASPVPWRWGVVGAMFVAAFAIWWVAG